MKNITTKAYILHTKSFKETSLLLNVFSFSYGRFSLIAKGIKRKNSQAKRAILQPFNLLKMEYSGRGELKVLCDVELVNLPNPLSSQSFTCGYYVNELLTRSLHEWQEFYSLFKLYHKTIELLQTSDDYSTILRNFEIGLLTELGLAPPWDIDIQGDAIKTDKNYHFIIDKGFEVISKRVNSISELSSVNNGFNGTAILCLANGEYKPEMKKHCQQITQLLLRQVIGNAPLQSRKLWVSH